MNTTYLESQLALQLSLFGKHLKRLRKGSGFITYREFSFVTGISIRQLEKIELGRVNLPLNKITRLAKTLNLRTVGLFNYQGTFHPLQLARSGFYCKTPEDESPLVSARIKQLREDKGLTYLDLEMETGMNRNKVKEYEEGLKENDFQTLVKFSVGLQVEMFDLFNYEDV